MPLDWTFSFLQVKPETMNRPEVVQIYSFRDGALQMSANAQNTDLISQMEPLTILFSYVAFFPDRNFVKIKLRTGSNQYAFHFLDKRFLQEHVLGCLSVTEFETQTPFEHWGYEETMAEYIFEYFWDLFKKNENAELQQEFPNWIKDQVADFYLDWLEAKNNRPAESLRQMAMSESVLKQMEQSWDIQLINEFGAPITELLSFIDAESFMVDDEEEKVTQNLTSMTLSALKMLIDTQNKWDIDYLKSKLENEMGYQYTLFKKFSIKDVRYLLIMNTSLYDFNKQTNIQIFRGNEQPFLESVAEKIKMHTDLFNMQGQLNRHEDQIKIQKLILETVPNYWK